MRIKLKDMFTANCAMNIQEKASYSKALLNLLKEITYNRNDRMGFDERSKFVNENYYLLL